MHDATFVEVILFEHIEKKRLSYIAMVRNYMKLDETILIM